MAATDDSHADSGQHCWDRRRWLAEKVASGELPAADSDLARQCDELFVGQDRVEDHARLLTGCFGLDRRVGVGDADPSAALCTYLQRLLSVREMWARERC